MHCVIYEHRSNALVWVATKGKKYIIISYVEGLCSVRELLKQEDQLELIKRSNLENKYQKSK